VGLRVAMAVLLLVVDLSVDAQTVSSKLDAGNVLTFLFVYMLYLLYTKRLV